MKWRIFNDDDPFFCKVFGHKWVENTPELSTCSRCDACTGTVQVVGSDGKTYKAMVVATKRAAR